MKKLILVNIIALMAVLAGVTGCQYASAVSSPAASSSSTLSPSGEGRWESFTDGNQVRDLLVSGNYLWAATAGGVVRWDMPKGTYQKYTTADGLASDNVYAVTRDNHGNLWFATGDGVSRFDGTHWQNFTTRDGLSYNVDISIASDNHGNIIVGALDSSISLYNGKAWRIIADGDVRPQVNNTGVQQLVTDKNGNIWAIIEGNLERYDGQSWHTLTEADGWIDTRGITLVDMVEAPDGSLWFSTGDSLLHYDGRSTQTIKINNPDIKASRIAFDSRGTLWCINEASISRYDGHSWQTYTSKVLNGSPVALMALTIDNNNNVWCANYNGIFRFDGQSWQTYITRDGLPDNLVRLMFADHSGNLWISTDRGLTLYDGQSWRTFTSANGLPEGNAGSLFQDQQGNLWYGTSRGDVGRYDGKSWQVFTDMPINTVNVITQDQQGNLWFGTTNFVYSYDGRSWKSYDLRIGEKNLNVMATDIAVDRAGNIWVATDNNGVLRYNGQDWKVFTVKDGLISNSVARIFQDSHGRLWFADEGQGVDLYSGQTWSSFSLDSLESVRSIAEDQAGNLWFGTDGAGVVEYSGGCWTNFTTANGLIGNTVNSIAIDGIGNPWFATNRGLSRYDGRSWQSFTTADGLPSNDVEQVATAKDGSLWFSTSSGISHYIPSMTQISAVSSNITPGTPEADSTRETSSPAQTGQQTDAFKPADELDGSQWKLVSIDSNPLVAGSYISLYFLKGEMWGYSGINTYGGKYLIKNPGMLTISDALITLMGGPEILNNQEQDYIKYFRGSVLYRLINNNLEISNPALSGFLEFERIPEYPMDPADLVGTRWELVSVNGKDVPDGVFATLAFEPGGMAVGRSGIFVANINYEAGGDSIYVLGTSGGNTLKGRIPTEMEEEAGMYSGIADYMANYHLTRDRLEILTITGEILVYKPL